MKSKNAELKESLIALASKEQFVPGICNYCDHWCDRCPKTQNCLSFAYEQQTKGIDIDEFNNDIANELFWNAIDQLETNSYRFIQDANQYAKGYIQVPNLQEFALEYGEAINNWLISNKEVFKTKTSQIILKYNNNRIITYSTAEKILKWYSLFIATKIERSLLDIEIRTNPDLNGKYNPFRDNIGSAKIAVIACDRSMAVLSLLYDDLKNQKNEILSFCVHLLRIKTEILEMFPDTIQFIRPGFDE